MDDSIITRNDERFRKLATKYYYSIGHDHHKDRDCHWYIEKKWSYDREPVYVAKHHGYILGDWYSPECGSYELAELLMINFLERAIEEHLDSAKEMLLNIEKDPDTWSWYSKEEIERTIRILSE